MAYQDDLKRLAEAGRSLVEMLERHRRFVLRTVEKYEKASQGGPMTYAAAVLSREREGLETVLAEPFDFAGLTTAALDTAQHVAMARFGALLSELHPTYDPTGHHQTEIRHDAQNLTPHTRKRLAQDVPRLHQSIAEVLQLIEAVKAGPAASAEASSGSYDKSHIAQAANHGSGGRDYDPGGGNLSGNGGDNGKSRGDATMANEESSVDGIINAISRLQGAGGLGAAGASGANTYNAFSNELDQKINLTLGMPSLRSDAAKALSSDALASKLYEGLDRTVAQDELGGVRTYEVNPLRARGATIEGEGMALGAQGVSAATIRSLKEPILANVYKMVAETVYGDQDEAEDLRIAIGTGLDKLIAEANADTGIYQDWAAEILVQIGIDLFRLASQYGILDRNSLPADLHGFAWAFLIEEQEWEVIAKLLVPAIDRILRDPDIGILTAEANDKAFSAIFHKLLTIARLILPRIELGPLVGRIRSLNDTIPASVISARNALAIAGVSEADQAVAFSKMTLPGDKIGEFGVLGRPDLKGDVLAARYSAGGISLRRLLAWIESESLTSRPFFLREDLNKRDVERLMAPREKQLEALSQIIERNFPMVNPNDYAIGRRHLIEVREHMDDLLGLMRVLVTSAERQSA